MGPQFGTLKAKEASNIDMEAVLRKIGSNPLGKLGELMITPTKHFKITATTKFK